MSDLNLTLTEIEPFEDVFTGGTVQDLATAITSNMQAVVNSDNVLTGQIGGAAPTSNIGLWLNGGAFYYWNGSAYVPLVISVGDGVHSVTLSSTPALNRTITFPDRDGTLALTSDVYVPRTTLVISALAIDWSVSFSFYKQISANSAFTFSNSLPGQVISVVIKTTGAFLATFPSSVFWPSGTAPSSTATGTDLFEFRNNAGSLYGRRVGAAYA